MRIQVMKSEKGFTFIESLFQLIVLAIAAQIITLIVFAYLNYMDLKPIHDELEWEMFVLETNYYLERGHTVTVDNLGKTISYFDPEERDYEHYIQSSKYGMINGPLYKKQHLMLPEAFYVYMTKNNGFINIKIWSIDGRMRERSVAYVPYSK